MIPLYFVLAAATAALVAGNWLAIWAVFGRPQHLRAPRNRGLLLFIKADIVSYYADTAGLELYIFPIFCSGARRGGVGALRVARRVSYIGAYF